MDKFEFAVATILYKPNERLFERIQLAAFLGHEVYVFDNSPGRAGYPDGFFKKPGMNYMTCGKNVGIGTALRCLCATAFHKGARFLLYFDQDTVFDGSTLDFAARTAANAGFGESAANRLLSITFRDACGAGSPASSGRALARTVPFTISSGTLFSLKDLKSLGWHDHRMFMDGVDYDICLRAKRSGLAVREIRGVPGLDHGVEQADSMHRIGRYRFSGRQYPWKRRVDVTLSHLRLISSAIPVDLSMAAWLAVKLLAFWVKQIIVVFSVRDDARASLRDGMGNGR